MGQWSGNVVVGYHGNMTYEGTDAGLATKSVRETADYNYLDYRSLKTEAVAVCQAKI